MLERERERWVYEVAGLLPAAFELCYVVMMGDCFVVYVYCVEATV